MACQETLAMTIFRVSKILIPSRSLFGRALKPSKKLCKKSPIILAQYGKPACQVITLQKCIDSGSNSTNFIFSASVRSIHISEAIMNWNKPKVKEICIGMEINDYFPAEF